MLGVKLAAPWCPDVGLRAMHGPFFASIYAKETFKSFVFFVDFLCFVVGFSSSFFCFFLLFVRLFLSYRWPF